MTKLISLSDRFHEQGEYNCPVCRHGKISRMTLMETFACNFCQHIFTTDFERQEIKMADSQLPLSWQWQGKHWQGVRKDTKDLKWTYLLLCLAFVGIPTLIVAIATYVFPPLPGSALSWLPLFWVWLTFFAHLFCLIMLVIEYYQLPIMLYLSALKRRLLPFGQI